MKFICSRDEIIKPLSYADSVVASRTTVQILTHLLLELENGTLKITAHDMEAGMEIKLPVNILEEGKITVPAKKLLAILREIGNCEVRFESDESNNLYIIPDQSKYNAKFRIAGGGAAEFPLLQKPQESKFIKIEQSLLKEMLTKTLFASAVDDYRDFTKGVLFHKKGNEISLVATDTTRLSYYKATLNDADDGEIECIVPRKVLVELGKLLENEGICRIAMDDKRIMFEINDILLFSVLINASYPNYKDVIPDSYDARISLSRLSMIETMKRASIFIDQLSRKITLTIYRNSSLGIEAESELGNAKEIIPLTSIDIKYEIENGVVVFNNSFLMDFLRHATSENIIIEVSHKKAAVLKEEGNENYIHLLMPLETILTHEEKVEGESPDEEVEDEF